MRGPAREVVRQRAASPLVGGAWGSRAIPTVKLEVAGRDAIAFPRIRCDGRRRNRADTSKMRTPDLPGRRDGGISRITFIATACERRFAHCGGPKPANVRETATPPCNIWPYETGLPRRPRRPDISLRACVSPQGSPRPIATQSIAVLSAQSRRLPQGSPPLAVRRPSPKRP